MSKSVPEVMQYCGVCEQNALLSDPLAWSDADMELDIELKKEKQPFIVCFVLTFIPFPLFYLQSDPLPLNFCMTITAHSCLFVC